MCRVDTYPQCTYMPTHPRWMCVLRLDPRHNGAWHIYNLCEPIWLIHKVILIGGKQAIWRRVTSSVISTSRGYWSAVITRSDDGRKRYPLLGEIFTGVGQRATDTYCIAVTQPWHLGALRTHSGVGSWARTGLRSSPALEWFIQARTSSHMGLCAHGHALPARNFWNSLNLILYPTALVAACRCGICSTTRISRLYCGPIG